MQKWVIEIAGPLVQDKTYISKSSNGFHKTLSLLVATKFDSDTEASTFMMENAHAIDAVCGNGETYKISTITIGETKPMYQPKSTPKDNVGYMIAGSFRDVANDTEIILYLLESEALQGGTWIKVKWSANPTICRVFKTEDSAWDAGKSVYTRMLAIDSNKQMVRLAVVTRDEVIENASKNKRESYSTLGFEGPMEKPSIKKQLEPIISFKIEKEQDRDMEFLPNSEELAKSVVQKHEYLENKVSKSVTHPAHYNQGKIEVLEFIIDKQLSYNVGQVVKYVARAGKKDKDAHMQDLEKALFYLANEINLVNASRGQVALRPNQLGDRIDNFLKDLKK